DDFKAAIYSLHASLRNDLRGPASQSSFSRTGWYGTELVESLYATDKSHASSVIWGPNGCTLGTSSLGYRLESYANAITSRSESDYRQLTPEERISIQAEARFFGAYAYNILANLYGGVPIVTEEITTPRRDFTRASREQVYQQCEADLAFAIAHLG